MSAEILQLLARIAELERKIDSMFRHGPVHDRKTIDGRWFVRLTIGGTEQEPFLSPWIPFSSPNGGPEGLNVHRVPAKGEQLTMLSPAGDPRQAVATSLFWSDHLTIECERFNLKGRDGSGITMIDGKLTLKANVIETDGETRLDKGSKQVHRMLDHDSHGDAAIEGAPRVYA